MNKSEIKDAVAELLPALLDAEMEEFDVRVDTGDIKEVAEPMIEGVKKTTIEAVDLIKKSVSAIGAKVDIAQNNAEKAAKDADEMLSTIKGALAAATPAAKAKIASVVGSATGAAKDESRTVAIMQRYMQPGKCPIGAGVKYIGPQGATKTYSARLHGRTAGFSHPNGLIECGCFEGLESLDLLGGIDPGQVGKGDAWKDGPITEAYRWVGTNDISKIEECVKEANTVMLLIDEINRMPQRERSIFLNSMSPELIDGYNVYKLRTGRSVKGPKGVLQDEILYAPCHLIGLVATGNVGLEFNVEEDDPAGRERWIEINVQPSDVVVRKIVKAKCDERGFVPAVVDGLMILHSATNKMKKDNLLNGASTIRTLTRIVELSPNDKPEVVREIAKDIGELWIELDQDGVRIKEQATLLEDTIKKAFK